MKTCYNCACDRVCNHTLNGYETCGNWVQKPLDPRPNADRIRAMSDEELAEQLVVSLDGIAPRTMWAAPATGKMYLSGGLAVKDMLAWLTQPAKEE